MNIAHGNNTISTPFNQAWAAHNPSATKETRSLLASNLTQTRQSSQRLEAPELPSTTQIMKQRQQLLSLRENVAAALCEQKSRFHTPPQLLANDYGVDFLQMQALAKDLRAMQASRDAASQLYFAILAEEFEMQEEIFNKCYLLQGTPRFSSDQHAMAKLQAAEKKLAVIDFCLMVLSLHEQAEWMPPSGNVIKVPNHLKKPVSADNLLASSLAKMEKIPVFSSKNGIDPDSGLYHEEQYPLSGTCVLHSNNHYLASWAQRENKTFLPITPRRLTLLVNGLACRRETTRRELTLMNIQKGSGATWAKFKASRSILGRETNLTSKWSAPLTIKMQTRFGQRYDTAWTGSLLSNKTTTLINELYGLTSGGQTIAGSATACAKNLNTISKLEQEQDSLVCTFSQEIRRAGHAIEFNKKDGIWYLHDSHARKPVPCSPSHFVKYLAREGNRELNINVHGRTVDYRQHHKFIMDIDLTFEHFEPLNK